VYFVTLCNYQL